MGTIDEVWNTCKVCTIIKECQKSKVIIDQRSYLGPIIKCKIACGRSIGNGIESNSTENRIKSSRWLVVDVNNKKCKHLEEEKFV